MVFKVEQALRFSNGNGKRLHATSTRGNGSISDIFGAAGEYKLGSSVYWGGRYYKVKWRQPSQGTKYKVWQVTTKTLNGGDRKKCYRKCAGL